MLIEKLSTLYASPTKNPESRECTPLCHSHWQRYTCTHTCTVAREVGTLLGQLATSAANRQWRSMGTRNCDGGTRFYPIDSSPPHELCRRGGESATSPLTPGDDRPGGEGRWTSRVIARPEHRLSDDLHAGEPWRAWRGGRTRWVYGCAELLRWRRATQRLSRCVISPPP
jgi:hypothetical protein